MNFTDTNYRFLDIELSEADTKAKLIDSALHRCGWTEDLIHREETARPIDIVEGLPRRRERGRIDYVLRIKVSPTAQPVAVALLEAKKNTDPPDKGLEQAKKYAKLHNVPFVYSTNGYLFVEYDATTGKTSSPKPIDEFPSPQQLRKRYEEVKGFSLDSEQAKPLLIAYPHGETTRRYYQDAAIRAVLEKIAQGKKRMLLYLATGSGKTFIAVHILKKIADAGRLRRALFVCDRDELRNQALSAFQAVFGADAAAVTSSNPQKNARVLIATYQTLNVATDTDDAKFFIENYPENYFSHIVIDECHRSAWGKWSIILRRNPDAIHIGLTATPRWFAEGLRKEDAAEDEEITANNYRYFGEPVYEYDIAQGIEDGYLAACMVIKREVDIDQKGITKEEIKQHQPKDALTGQLVKEESIKDKYEAESFEDEIQLPDRVKSMCADLFNMLLQTGDPHQKTVVFCVRDSHADAVAAELNNLYADWCKQNNQPRLEPYAFKCTASVSGSTYLADLRGSERSHFIATTVDLITTGVDVPILQNVVFFRYIKSPILFHQMLGRGSRIHLPTNKLMFRVYDYTDATRLLGKLGPAPVPKPPVPPQPPRSPKVKEKIIRVEGFDVHINEAGEYIVMNVEGEIKLLSIEEYKQFLAAKLSRYIKSVNDLVECWIDPQKRSDLINILPQDGRNLNLLKKLTNKENYDTYDIIAEILFGIAAKSRTERVLSFEYKNKTWLDTLPQQTKEALFALIKQFEKGGIEELETPLVFKTKDVLNAGGLEALRHIGDPQKIIMEAKRRLFAL